MSGRFPYYHYAPAYRYRVIEYWNWSANFVTVDNGKEGLPSQTYGPYMPYGPVEIYLGDYHDLSNGVWRISR